MSEGALKMLATALEMERKGKRFYERAVATCKGRAATEVFQTLLGDEVKHIERITRIYKAVQGGAAFDAVAREEGPTESVSELFRGLARRHGSTIESDASDLEALEVGIDLESKSIAYYEAHLSRTSDEQERSFLGRMILEEKDHYAALSDMKVYLTDPAAWFQEHERPGLDGG